MKKETKIAISIFIIGLSFVAIVWFLTSCGPCEYHIFEKEIVREATCTDNGIESRYCTKCGYSEEEEILASHDFREQRTIIEATCTRDGMKLEKCSVCDLERERATSASHSFSGLRCMDCGYAKPFPELSLGMSKSRVKSLCGEPLDIDRNTSQGGTRETWWYKHEGKVISIYFNTDGKISHITET